MSLYRSETQLIDACRVLFPAALIHHEFLRKLRLPNVKAGYRELAKKYHPDCCSEPQDSALMAESFRKVNHAYQILCAYLQERDLSGAQRPCGAPSTAASEARGPQPEKRTFRPRPQYARPVKPARTASDVYYEGPLPTFPLKIGLFLYYKGAIPYAAVVQALIWQRDMRPPIGELSVAWGWLEPHFVSVIRSATEIPGSFGERAVQLGLLTPSQVTVMLLQQRLMQAHTGRYFVGKGYLTEFELNNYLRELAQFNREQARKPNRA
jgi:hypothetical protein